jgi:hypothetical protein
VSPTVDQCFKGGEFNVLLSQVRLIFTNRPDVLREPLRGFKNTRIQHVEEAPIVAESHGAHADPHQALPLFCVVSAEFFQHLEMILGLLLIPLAIGQNNGSILQDFLGLFDQCV